MCFICAKNAKTRRENNSSCDDHQMNMNFRPGWTPTGQNIVDPAPTLCCGRRAPPPSGANGTRARCVLYNCSKHMLFPTRRHRCVSFICDARSVCISFGFM